MLKAPHALFGERDGFISRPLCHVNTRRTHTLFSAIWLLIQACGTFIERLCFGFGLRLPL